LPGWYKRFNQNSQCEKRATRKGKPGLFRIVVGSPVLTSWIDLGWPWRCTDLLVFGCVHLSCSNNPNLGNHGSCHFTNVSLNPGVGFCRPYSPIVVFRRCSRCLSRRSATLCSHLCRRRTPGVCFINCSYFVPTKPIIDDLLECKAFHPLGRYMLSGGMDHAINLVRLAP
jgi:hypothetical protein